MIGVRGSSPPFDTAHFDQHGNNVMNLRPLQFLFKQFSSQSTWRNTEISNFNRFLFEESERLQQLYLFYMPRITKRFFPHFFNAFNRVEQCSKSVCVESLKFANPRKCYHFKSTHRFNPCHLAFLHT